MYLSQNEEIILTRKPEHHLLKFLLCVWWNVKCFVYYKLSNLERSSPQTIVARNRIGEMKYLAFVKKIGVIFLGRQYKDTPDKTNTRKK